MAVTKQTYTASATWTTAQLASAVRSAFIDAGLMSEWFDSFLSGSVENRILEVQHNAAKVYGKSYYWFQFTTGGIFVHVASGWNAASDIPAGPGGAGTQYLDWFSTTTNSTSNHCQIIALTTTTDFTITRYTSAITSGYSWFLLRNGSNNRPLHIARAAAPIAPWIDLDKVLFHWMGTAQTTVMGNAGSTGQVMFNQFPTVLRRSHCGGGLRGVTSSAVYGSGLYTYPPNADDSPLGQYGLAATHRFVFQGTGSNNFAAYRNPDNGASRGWGVMLPIGINLNNPAYSADSSPVMTGFPPTLYINESMPADFGIASNYVGNTMAVLDTFTVTAGTEVWEILSVANSSGSNGASPMFMARTTG